MTATTHPLSRLEVLVLFQACGYQPTNASQLEWTFDNGITEYRLYFYANGSIEVHEQHQTAAVLLTRHLAEFLRFLRDHQAMNVKRCKTWAMQPTRIQTGTMPFDPLGQARHGWIAVVLETYAIPNLAPGETHVFPRPTEAGIVSITMLN